MLGGCYAAALGAPHVEGAARWVLLGAFIGAVCLLLRSLEA